MADADYSNEIWKDLPGFEGWYRISSLGRLESCPRQTPTRNRWGPCVYTTPAKILAGRIDKDGYRKFTLCKAGAVSAIFAHRAVALAFHGQPPSPLHEVAHGDGSKDNNAADNLRWATAAENAKDKVLHGSTANQFGERHSHNKLTEAQVREIRATPHTYGSDEAFARKFGVRAQAIGKVRRRERWPHIK